MSKDELQYYVRKSWDDVDSQVGIPYNFLINAKKACDKLENYYVFDSNGNMVYPEIKKEILPKVEEKKMFNVGDEVRLIPGATFVSGKAIKAGWFNSKLYVREIDNDNVTISNAKKGSVIGTVSSAALVNYNENITIEGFNDYNVIVNDNTTIHNGANKNNKVIGKAKKYNLYTIIQEQNGMGKLKIGAGWIDLSKVDKLV